MTLARPRLFLLALAFGLLAACASSEEATPSPWVKPPDDPTPTPVVTTGNEITRIVVHLSPVEGEGQIGSATLSSDGVTTTVEVEVDPEVAEVRPIHIHIGQCGDVGSVLHALENLVKGKSVTTIDQPLSEILPKGVLVNVHASYADISNYTACSPLPETLP